MTKAKDDAEHPVPTDDTPPPPRDVQREIADAAEAEDARALEIAKAAEADRNSE